MAGSWTAITDGTFDEDSPVTDALLEDIVENTEYNNEHAVRAGTHAAGVRLALARATATSEFTISTDANGDGSVSWDITIANATDGAPNYSAAPTVVGYSCEDSGGGTAWGNGCIYSVRTTGTSTSTINTRIAVTNGPASTSIKGYLTYALVGPVTSGE